MIFGAIIVSKNYDVKILRPFLNSIVSKQCGTCTPHHATLNRHVAYRYSLHPQNRVYETYLRWVQYIFLRRRYSALSVGIGFCGTFQSKSFKVSSFSQSMVFCVHLTLSKITAFFPCQTKKMAEIETLGRTYSFDKKTMQPNFTHRKAWNG